MIEVPFREISQQALLGLLDAMINREGTDYGEIELSLEQKQQQMLNALARKELVVAYEPISEEFSVLAYEDFIALAKAFEQGEQFNGGDQ